MESALWLLVLPVLGALIAVGCLLLIKITRRRQATRSGNSSDVVPANPMSAEQARMITRRYAIAVGIVLVALILVAISAT
ncbi:hypothetical protein [uncultured Abyssibacter sp.]|uniref:hypothetical protein n=1 Tax=uncultured Abyssibacter sp. TaxID=2320202 RepID=UPI0032B2F56E